MMNRVNVLDTVLFLAFFTYWSPQVLTIGRYKLYSIGILSCYAVLILTTGLAINEGSCISVQLEYC